MPAGLAPAKINLCLHVTGQRPDGYHMLDSLVVFTRLGDLVEVEPASTLSLSISGPFSLDLGAGDDNLVLRAAELIRPAGQGAALHLTKTLPVASGIGGGSSDAAAALRALKALWGVDVPGARSLAGLGADVPVCWQAQPCRMRGIGEEVTALPASLPQMWMVLANPGVHIPTPRIFAALADKHNGALPTPLDLPRDFANFTAWLTAATRNDLQAPAVDEAPVIARVLSALGETKACALARMSGSGATCFGLYPDQQPALDAAAQLRAQHPNWWVAATDILPGLTSPD
ncbi:MAG: 4-(cytidine 5'-diphospho)-2-C-methyl-D-erythritol kinase [Pseudomonadota bacterium]